MKRKRAAPPGRELGEGYKYVSLGLSFAAGIIFFVGIGFWLDRTLGLTPLFTLIGTLGGSALSFTWVYLKLAAERKAPRSGQEHDGGAEP